MITSSHTRERARGRDRILRRREGAAGYRGLVAREQRESFSGARCAEGL
jgi:hypothetical protein